MLQTQEVPKGIDRSFPTYDALQEDLVKRFKFLGNLGACRFLHVVGEETSPHEERMATSKPEGMVAKARPRRSKA